VNKDIFKLSGDEIGVKTPRQAPRTQLGRFASSLQSAENPQLFLKFFLDGATALADEDSARRFLRDGSPLDSREYVRILALSRINEGFVFYSERISKCCC